MKRKNMSDPRGEQIPTVYIRVFGFRIWFEAKSKRQFWRNCIAAGRLYKLAKKTNEQLLQMQELLSE